MLRCASGHSTEEASTRPISSCSGARRWSSPASALDAISPVPKASCTVPSSGRRASCSARLRSSRARSRAAASIALGLALAVPHQHDEVAQGVVQPGLFLDHAFQHHGVGAGVQEAPQPPTVLAAAPHHRSRIEAGVRHEVQARDREPAILRRIEVRQVVAVADRAAALDLGVDAAQAEHEAHEADRGEDVEEVGEEREADEGRAQQQQVGRDEDRVDVVVRLAAEEDEGGERDQQGGDDVLEPGGRHADRAAGDQRLGRLREHFDARHDRVHRRRLGVVEAGGGVADEHDGLLQRRRRVFGAPADRRAFDEKVRGAQSRQPRVLAPVGTHGGRELRAAACESPSLRAASAARAGPSRRLAS